MSGLFLGGHEDLSGYRRHPDRSELRRLLSGNLQLYRGSPYAHSHRGHPLPRAGCGSGQYLHHRADFPGRLSVAVKQDLIVLFIRWGEKKHLLLQLKGF